MKHLKTWPLAALLATASLASHAQFFDQGMVNTPVVRTDFSDPNYGTSSSPVVMGTCLFPGSHHCTSTQPLVYSESNFWSQNWPSNCSLSGSCGRYWAVMANNETAEATDSSGKPLNPGPPDASLPLVSPGSGIMGFATHYGSANFPGDTFWRAHLVLDVNAPGTPPVGQPIPGGLPFLGFGAWTDPNGAGNGGPIAQIQPWTASSPSYLSFSQRLWSVQLPQGAAPGQGQPGLVLSELHIFANWGSHPKAVQILLYSNSTQPPFIAADQVATGGWAWPYVKSGFYPGAWYASLNASDLPTICPSPNYSVGSLPALVHGQDVQFDINLYQVFRCLSDKGKFDEPLPASGTVDVSKVIWAVEGAGKNGSIWVDVHNQKIKTFSDYQ